ncbi:MAG TPA: MFS transporter [Victivallales bacterium]|nr:MFS transporter [Victivallales bacterium]
MVKLKKTCLLFGISLLTFTGYLDATIVSTALPSIQSSLNMSMTQLQWILNAFLLGIAASMASMGRVGDIYGRRKVFYIAVAIFALASIGAGLSTSPIFLIFCRGIQGITTGAVIPIGIALIQTSHKPEDVAKAMGIFSSITGAGLAIGPVAGGALVYAFGWRGVFFINVPFVLAGFLLCLFSVEESRSSTEISLDYLGVLFLTITIVGVVFGVVEAANYGWNSLNVIISFIVSVISLIGLVLVEHKVKHPIWEGGYLKTGFLSPVYYIALWPAV